MHQSGQYLCNFCYIAALTRQASRNSIVAPKNCTWLVFHSACDGHKTNTAE
jgi:hypothetical protein